MSAESDNGWVSVASLGAYITTFVLGALVAAFAKGINWASVQGETRGAIMIRLSKVEVDIAEIKSRKDRIDMKLESVATRDELDEVGNRIERRVADVDAKITRMYELRFGLPLVLPPPRDERTS